MAQARASIGTIDYAVSITARRHALTADSQQRVRLADIVERGPATLALKRGATITTTLT